MITEQRWKFVKLFLKLAITSASLYFVFSKVSLEDLKEAFVNANPFYLLSAFLIFGISQFVASTRLNRFFQGVGLNLDRLYNFKLYLLGMFYNLFLPGGIGGDGYKIYFLKKRTGIKNRRLLTAVFLDRLSGVWALGLITALLIIFIPKIDVSHWIPLSVFAIGTLLYYLIVRLFFREYIPSFLATHFRAIMVQSLQLIAVICVLYALSFRGKFSPYLLMFFASSLVSIFPFTVGGLGAREVVFLYGAEYFQLDSHLAVLISLLFYFISALLSLFGTYFIFNPQSLDKLQLEEGSKANFIDKEN